MKENAKQEVRQDKKKRWKTERNEKMQERGEKCRREKKKCSKTQKKYTLSGAI